MKKGKAARSKGQRDWLNSIGESVHTCSVHDAELWRCGHLGIMGNCLNCEFDDADASPFGKHEYNEMID